MKGGNVLIYGEHYDPDNELNRTITTDEKLKMNSKTHAK